MANDTPPTKVIKVSCLPTRLSAINLTLIYILYSVVFKLPVWSDVIVGFCLVCLALVQAHQAGREISVDIFKQ